MKLTNLESVKQALESELDLKCVVLNEANGRINTLLAENRLISDDLDQVKKKSEEVQGELYGVKVRLNETCSEVSCQFMHFANSYPVVMFSYFFRDCRLTDLKRKYQS